MASSHSLLSLVSQLQNMELSFTTILMEAAMKLSALTDANVFVLVETQEGRKFSGKRHLCDAYLGSGLSPTGNDVEFVVNPAVSALRERRVPAAHSPNVFPEASFSSLSSSSRRSDGRSSNLSHRRKRAPDANSTNPNGSLKFARRTLSADSPRVDTASVASTVKEEFDLTMDQGLTSDREDALVSNGFGDSRPPYCYDDATASTDDDDIQWMPPSTTPVDGTVSFDDAFPSTDNPDNHLALCRLSSQVPPNLDLAKLEEYSLMRVSPDKLEALHSLPPHEIFEKGTVGHRLLNSVMYEVGRSIAQTCAGLGLTSPKDPESKTIFSACFDKWIADNLAHLANSDERLENLSRSPLGFMKQNARVHFYKVMSTVLKDKPK